MVFVEVPGMVVAGGIFGRYILPLLNEDSPISIQNLLSLEIIGQNVQSLRNNCYYTSLCSGKVW